VNDQPRTETRLLVTQDRDGERLDVFLAAATNLSRRAARRVIADGSVRRNRETLRVQSRSVTLGDVIDVQIPESELGVETTPPLKTIDPIFEDRWLIIVSKPAGVLSQPAEGQRPGDTPAFDQQVLLSLARREGQRPFLRLVHRLDRMTSGAMLFARSPDVLPKLSHAWGSGQVERHYLAVIEGQPASNTFSVDRPIARDRDHRWRFQCDDGGKPSRTEVEVLATIDDNLAVIGCRLVTGRTHQVRVHLATAGHPVLGDRLYHSKRADLAQRPLLHAIALSLPHPATGENLHVVCPPPVDLAKYVPADLDLSRI
jgi:23S rRNA pseudouridine1911/1915/1917 synthase